MKEVLPGWLMVEIPSDAHSFEIYENNVVGGWCIMYLRGIPDYACNYTGNLPLGSWEIVGIVTEVSEEGMIDVARSNGFDPDNTILLKKKV